MTIDLAENLNEYSEILGVDVPLAEAIEKSEPGDIPRLLKRIAEEPQTETERSVYIDKLAKKASVSKRAINKDLKRLMPDLPEDDDEWSKAALFEGLVDIVLNEDGEPAYLVKEGESLTMKTSHDDAEKSLIIPPPKNKLPFGLVNGKEVMRLVCER